MEAEIVTVLESIQLILCFIFLALIAIVVAIVVK